MRSIILILVLLLGNASASAQLRVEYVTVSSSSDSIRFPQVVGRSDAIRKINYHMQHELFNGIAEGEGLRDYVRSLLYDQNTGELDGIEGMEDSIWRNDERVLSINARVYGVAAHVWDYASGMSFDVATGRALLMQDIFRDDKRKELNRILERQYRSRIAKSKMENGADDGDHSDEYADLEACVRDHTREMPVIGHHKIAIIRNQCLAHIDQPLDINWDVELDYKTVKPLLTDYGRSLFEGKRVAIAAPPYPIVYLEGTVGDLPVVMRIDQQAEGPKGSYFYKKSGRPLSLSGEYRKDKWYLEEADIDSYTTTGYLEGVFDGRTFVGVWRTSNRKRKLPLSLKVF
jgi:hypothetical protein